MIHNIGPLLNNLSFIFLCISLILLAGYTKRLSNQVYHLATILKDQSRRIDQLEHAVMDRIQSSKLKKYL